MKLAKSVFPHLGEILAGSSSGSQLVKLFNKYGFRDDVYVNGLPKLDKQQTLNTTKKQYLSNRLNQLNDTELLRKALVELINFDTTVINQIAELIKTDGYTIQNFEDNIEIVGGVKVETPEISQEAHFKEIQSKILNAHDKAQVSIMACIAWFTNQTLANKLIEKKKLGLDVKVIVYDDHTNTKYGVDLGDVPVKKVKAERKGLMHNKFCVIDNQTTITGSYNWSLQAEVKNDENIQITENGNKSATQYSVEFNNIWNQ